MGRKLPFNSFSQIRTKLIGKTEPNYSEYTCYTGISDFTPPDIDTVRSLHVAKRHFMSSLYFLTSSLI